MLALVPAAAMLLLSNYIALLPLLFAVAAPTAAGAMAVEAVALLVATFFEGGSGVACWAFTEPSMMFVWRAL